MQTRLEIAKLHHEMDNVTMIYVTHDQVEAMTADGRALAAGAKGLIDPGLFPQDAGDTAYLAPQILVEV
ncbi:hypothetical protein CNY89_30335, partial [Amaricoccus sp. HAR-UPW-R2A-40]